MALVQDAIDDRRPVTGHDTVRVLLRIDEAWQAEDWRRRYLSRIPKWIVDTISENEVTARLLVDDMVERGVDEVLLAGQSDLTFAVVAELAQRERERGLGEVAEPVPGRHGRRAGRRPGDRGARAGPAPVRQRPARPGQGGARARRCARWCASGVAEHGVLGAGLQRRRRRGRPAHGVPARRDVPAAARLLPPHRGQRPGRGAAARAGPRVRHDAGRRAGPAGRQLGADRPAAARALRAGLPRPRQPGAEAVGRAGPVLPRVQRAPGAHRPRRRGRGAPQLGRERRRGDARRAPSSSTRWPATSTSRGASTSQRHRWSWGPTRDRGARRHPDLLPWAELSEESRGKTRTGVTESLALLETLGYRSFDDPYATWVRLRRTGR